MRKDLADSGIARYFIAIVPPSPVFELAAGWKAYFKDKFHSKAALKSPPHITLHMPFEWKVSKEDALVEKLAEFFLSRESFTLTFENFSSFPPRVIFLAVNGDPLLGQLYSDLQSFCKRNLNLFNAGFRDLPFHPHLTLAFRDLKKEQYALAWEEFSRLTFSATFAVDQISLLKYDGKQWQIHRSFGFSR